MTNLLVCLPASLCAPTLSPSLDQIADRDIDIMAGFQPWMSEVTQKDSLESLLLSRLCFHCPQDWAQARIPDEFCKLSVCK